MIWWLLACGGAVDSDSNVVQQTPSEEEELPPEPKYEFCTELTVGDTAAPVVYDDIVGLFGGCKNCHRSSPTGLSFSAPYDELVGTASFQVPELARVEPFDLQGSYLWHKLCGTQENVGGMGRTMPISGKLSEADVFAIGSWIAAGAPQ